MDPHLDREREVIHEHHDTVVTDDEGTGAGAVLGIVLAIILAAALIWFVLGSNLFGATGGGGTTSPSSPSIQSPSSRPSRPSQINPPRPQQPSGSSGGGTTSGSGSVSGSEALVGPRFRNVSGGGSVKTTLCGQAGVHDSSSTPLAQAGPAGERRHLACPSPKALDRGGGRNDRGRKRTIATSCAVSRFDSASADDTGERVC